MFSQKHKIIRSLENGESQREVMASYLMGYLAVCEMEGKVKCILVQALRLCSGCTAHRGSREIALLRLCTGRTAHRGSRDLALLRLCTGCMVHRGVEV
jgi:hypothetical protein